MENTFRMKLISGLCILTVLSLFAGCSSTKENTNVKTTEKPTYIIVATGQNQSYDNDGKIITPSKGEAYYGQDAQYGGLKMSFTDNGDGTVTDNNTGLIWQKTPSDDKFTWENSATYCDDLTLAGHDDWRIPTAKELFSISDFETGWPYLDTQYFDFPAVSTDPVGPQGSGPQGAESQSSSTLDDNAMPSPPPPEDSSDGSIGKEQGQFWTSDLNYVGTEGMETAFGVNQATGHIKAYPIGGEAVGPMGKHVRAVRTTTTAINEFVDNEDGTISDLATGLMWMKNDSGTALEWKDALSYCEDLSYAGHDDWKLPNVKELHSIVKYSDVYPAIDKTYFDMTELDENVNYYFWTSTSAYFAKADPTNAYAWYVAFGYAVGNDGKDSHGAGAIRFSPKYTESAAAKEGGDNILNSVRAVREIIQ